MIHFISTKSINRKTNTSIPDFTKINRIKNSNYQPPNERVAGKYWSRSHWHDNKISVDSSVHQNLITQPCDLSMMYTYIWYFTADAR